MNTRSRLGAFTERLSQAHKWRRTRRLLAGMPDLILNDVGLARDWRGDVVRLPEGFK